MGSLFKHWPRIAVTLLPLVFVLLHASGVLKIGVLQRLDDIIYDGRLRVTMPRTLDDRVVIVDVDEKSLAEVGHWPWGRDKLANLTHELFARQKAAILGLDVLFAEADESSGLKSLQQLAQGELRDQPGFAERLSRLQAGLDYDALFAKALEKRPVVLGYYFTSDRDGRTKGVLPAPVMQREALQGRPIRFTSWNGYGANIEPLARAAPVAGFFNSITDGDGVVRSIPLIAEYDGQYYESLSLAMFRMLVGSPQVEPGFPKERFLSRTYQGLESILLKQGGKTLAIPVDDRVATLVPFRGSGGASGGSYRYISAADVLSGRLPEASLKDRIVLLGTTAPGLLDLRVTPVGETYPGVETHANVISGLLDGKIFVKPDYAVGFEVVTLVLAGLILAFTLPQLSAPRAVMLSAAVIAAQVGLNFWLYLGYGLVLPLASALLMALTAFALNMSYGYFVESRSKRELANLFGTYVPPELVDEMVKDPDSYSMKAANKELTVMFCDMRGFTKMSEQMEPTQLQELLNGVFSRLTDLIRANRGTIDKYMGDCVMAFWGAPVDTPNHAHLAVKTAMEMAQAVRKINEEHRAAGIPEIGIGIGLNTGTMCVGDMGSDIRRSYTVIGDSVNLGSRLEGLSKAYGVDIVVSESTRKLAPDFAWQELDKVRVKGKEQAVAIFWPMAPADRLDKEHAAELRTWAGALKSYRAQDWDPCDVQLLNLQRMNAKKYLYQLYSERVASMRLLPFDPGWDGATNFETK
ncbi:CHASE2 domain-containing protein [Variovorax terrae]|uniref:Adenylate/guanylate cyclase domain-containing protein n=1 Tax=Variovorax terrae TaxID=2923278 RepID=A0A9X2APX5_9BURK|nr:adenylate/guanylate cyclase domain-containing protein [Variovorax terrae]MCJ0765799.1 adenylate/guanylate cyclase domain-containing protein [Variovorax terrae]